MHQALYNKWRPKRFSDVCGQDHVTAILRYEVENGKTSHAYLFCGSRGTGKTSCAKILARAVNCEHPEGGDPCGECPSCVAATSESCMDIIEMDAASNNGVDDIRAIRDEVGYLPAELKYKVYIIDEVHMLSASAFNALLKTLEEPPSHVIFILATTELQKIPATILSRCQRFDFRRISSEVIAARLEYIAGQEGIEIDREAAFMLAHLAQGGMRDAISLLELCSGEDRPITPEVVEEIVGTGGRDSVLRLVNAVCDRDYDTIFGEIGRMFMSSRDLAVFWQDIIAFYRDMLVVKATKNSREYLDLTEKQYGELIEAAGRFSVEMLIYHSRLLDEALDSLKRASTPKRLTAEMTLVRMCDERFSNSNEALASRLATLEDKLKSGAYRIPEVKSSKSGIPEYEASESDTLESDTSEYTVSELGMSEPESSEPVMAEPGALESGMSEPKAPESESAPTANKTGDAGDIPRVRKQYRQLPYWADFVQKCTERDGMLGSFMRETSKGYTVNTDGFVHIRTNNQMAQTIITNMFQTLLEVLNTFEDGRLDRNSVKLEYVPEKKDGNYSAIDEIIKNAENEEI